MMRKKDRKERYSVIISSRTDARKKPVAIRLTRRMLIIAACALPFAVLSIAGAAIGITLEASRCGEEVAGLETEADIQLSLIDTYSFQLCSLRQAQQEYGAYMAAIEYTALQDAAESAAAASGEGVEMQRETALSLYLSANGFEKGTSLESLPLIPMTDAITMINADFQVNIDAQIESLKKKENYNDYNIVYDGDFEGDSNAVSNWADVLSIYAAETMSSGQKFLTITPGNIGLLSEIYNEMNEITLTAEPMPEIPEAASMSVAGEDMLAIRVSVNSLTYEEEEKKRKLSRKQKKLVNNLMSPHYYTYFADLLGIDVYDGMRSEELEEIIADLPKGTKGSAIVQAAIMRIGHPYSRSRRGSGNYVDCSYFAWWAYNQAGISIPTTSVEQAKYCSNKGYVVKMDDLKPGDLIFWRKTTCNCGRWREIHHAGIYIGKGKVIDASSSKGRVVMRKLWSDYEWKVALCARPYKEDAPLMTAAGTEDKE